MQKKMLNCLYNTSVTSIYIRWASFLVDCVVVFEMFIVLEMTYLESVIFIKSMKTDAHKY